MRGLYNLEWEGGGTNKTGSVLFTLDVQEKCIIWPLYVHQTVEPAEGGLVRAPASVCSACTCTGGWRGCAQGLSRTKLVEGRTNSSGGFLCGDFSVNVKMI